MVKEINFFEQEMETAPRENIQKNKNLLQKRIFPASFPGVDIQKLIPEQQQPEKASRTRLKRIIEALLFVSHEPISFNKIREILDTVETLKPRQIQDLLQEMAEEFILQQRAFRLKKLRRAISCEHAKNMDPY